MKYAVVSTGGHQFRITEGDVIEVARLNLKPKEEYTLSDVLLYVEDNTRIIGTPKVPEVLVTAEVIKHTQGDKIKVRKYKAKVRYRRVIGHRSQKTALKIKAITHGIKKVKNTLDIA